METTLTEATTFLESLTPLHWAIAGVVLLLIFIIIAVKASQGRKRREKVAPKLMLEAFQISPLGRDAYLKIKNNGEPATLTSLFVRGRRDIVFKNAFAGHQLEKGKVYGILMEAASQEKIAANFSVELTYFDAKRNVYRQSFDLGNNATRQPKLVQAGR